MSKTTKKSTTAADVLTAAEVSRWLRIPKSTVYKLAQDGKIPAKNIGRHWRFERRRLEAWLAQADLKGGQQ